MKQEFRLIKGTCFLSNFEPYKIFLCFTLNSFKLYADTMGKLLALQPKTLFLIDGIGALVTAFLLFAVLKTFHEYFGMPECVLTWLSAIAVVFSIYSLTCSFLVKRNWKPFLVIIATANLLYCCLTTLLVVYYFPFLTILGVLYFLGEIAIICGLVFIELKILGKKEQS